MDASMDDSGACVMDDSGACAADAGGGVPLACDGSLCDTSNSSQCGVAAPGVGTAPMQTGLVMIVVLMIGAARRIVR